MTNNDNKKMMNARRLLMFAVWISSCAVAPAQDDSNAQPSIVTNRIAMLQSARHAGLPGTLGPKSETYRTIERLGRSAVNKQQVANELVEWLFISEPDPGPFASTTDRNLHPAAMAIVSIGTEAVGPLEAKLSIVTTPNDAVLIIRCLRQIYKPDPDAPIAKT